MTNKLSDLNEHLFAQLERLDDETLTKEQIEHECKRTEAIVAVSEQLIRSANVSLGAAKLVGEYGANVRDGLPLLEPKKTTPPIEGKAQT